MERENSVTQQQQSQLASMIMGTGPEQHGIIDNDWEREEHSLPPIVMGEEGIFPTIFGVIRKNNPAAEIGTVQLINDNGLAYSPQDFSRIREYSPEA